MMPSRSRGFLSVDALLSILPLMMLALLFIQASFEISMKAERALEAQQAFDKLVSAADHTVKIGAAVREGAVRYPNWIDEGLLGPGYSDSLKERLGLRSLYVSLEPPEMESGNCVFRLVVAGKEKRMARLYVCGD